MNQNVCAIKMPTEETKSVTFKNFKNTLKVPFVVYADFESILNPITNRSGDKTEAYQRHEAFSIGYYFKDGIDDQNSYYKDYRGEDCIKWFCVELYGIYGRIKPQFDTIIPMQLTSEEEDAFQAAQMCHICANPFSILDTKTRDHNHLTGQFRGAAHQGCNLLFQDSRTVPVIFHNLSGEFYFLQLIINNNNSLF